MTTTSSAILGGWSCTSSTVSGPTCTLLMDGPPEGTGWGEPSSKAPGPRTQGRDRTASSGFRAPWDRPTTGADTMTQPAGRIVVGVDGSPTSLAALRFAHRQAQLTGAELHAVTTWTYPLSFDDPVDPTDWQANAETILETP